MTTMQHLVKLEIMFCNLYSFGCVVKEEAPDLIPYKRGFIISPNDCFHSLLELVIWRSDFLCATWLVYAPHLQKLTRASCKMGGIIGDDLFNEENEIKVETCSSLQTLHLHSLPGLNSICSRALPFPCLSKIQVSHCRNLSMLPLNASSENDLKQIKGEATWWNWLVWEDMDTKDAFSTKFIEISTMFEERKLQIH